MNYIFIFINLGFLFISLGVIFYYHLFLKKRLQEKEKILQEKIATETAKQKKILVQTEEEIKNKANQAEEQISKQRKEILELQKLVLKREKNLDKKEENFKERVEKLQSIKIELKNLSKNIEKNLEEISGLSKEEAEKKLLKVVENEVQSTLLSRMEKLEKEADEKLKEKAQEILSSIIQRYSVSQAQELSISTVALPNEEIKGRIIGKEGRNIKSLERLTGVELIIDETPETITISSFDPIRRQIAKIALEKLIKDGRIQPAKIEEAVASAEKEINEKIKEIGNSTVYDLGIVDLNPKLIQLIGRLYFRTSYGQNNLTHSIEVSHLARAIAEELSLNSKIAQKAGLLHDIGKGVDIQIEGTHVDIGIKILEKYGMEKEVINAMKAHHEEYPYESLEAIIVQTADAISSSRPGARKDNLENYLKRLTELENIVKSFEGIEKAYAIQAGREIRVFVKADVVKDYGMKKLAKDIANKIQEEVNYPGEIKVNVIRETRTVEYAK
jgi:ribonuclease Y